MDHEKEYLWLAGSFEWGESVTSEQNETLCQIAEGFLDEREAPITVRPPWQGQAPGIYERRADGSWQILGYSIPVPEKVEELTKQAWMHACESFDLE